MADEGHAAGPAAHPEVCHRPDAGWASASRGMAGEVAGSHPAAATPPGSGGRAWRTTGARPLAGRRGRADRRIVMAKSRRPSPVRIATVAGLIVVAVVALAAYLWRDDVVKALLDPQVPFGKDRPAPAPDYARRSSWALLPDPAAPPGPVDIFFVHPTSYPASFTS